MPGRRRVQRSVRVTVAVALLAAAAGCVSIAVAASTAVTSAAAFSVLAGVAAVRMVYSEVVRTRRDCSRSRAEQSRAFGATVALMRAEQAALTESMTLRLKQRDSTIVGLDGTVIALNGTVRLAQKRAEVAESRVSREAHRADDAETRLSELLDAVLAQQVATVEPDEPAPTDDMPTVVDMIAWEERAVSARSQAPRRQA